jgi:hypothetical protein
MGWRRYQVLIRRASRHPCAAAILSDAAMTKQETDMALIKIKDLRIDRALDREAMAAIRGGGAPWVFGWIRPYVAATQSFGSVINFFQINNNYFADQLINQVQNVEINNSASNANINVALAETSANHK